MARLRGFKCMKCGRNVWVDYFEDSECLPCKGFDIILLGYASLMDTDEGVAWVVKRTPEQRNVEWAAGVYAAYMLLGLVAAVLVGAGVVQRGRFPDPLMLALTVVSALDVVYRVKVREDAQQRTSIGKRPTPSRALEVLERSLAVDTEDGFDAEEE